MKEGYCDIKFLLRRVTLVLLIVIVFSGCGEPYRRRVRPDPTNPIHSVAVLPLYNVTNDLDGPQYIRGLVNAEFKTKQYNVKPLEEVNSLLINQMGIVLGSQLEMTTPQVIGKVLGVDALVYGYLLDFDDVLLGIYNARIVRAGFKLVDTKTGAVLWSGGRGVKVILVSGGVGVITAVGKELLDNIDGLSDFDTIKGLKDINGLDQWTVIPMEVDKAGDAALLTLGALVVGKALGVHLHFEAGVVVRESLKDLGAGSGNHLP